MEKIKSSVALVTLLFLVETKKCENIRPIGQNVLIETAFSP